MTSNEIRQLRADLGAATKQIDQLQAENERLRAERDRLREAVEFAHSEGFEWPSDPFQQMPVSAEESKDG